MRCQRQANWPRGSGAQLCSAYLHCRVDLASAGRMDPVFPSADYEPLGPAPPAGYKQHVMSKLWGSSLSLEEDSRLWRGS